MQGNSNSLWQINLHGQRDSGEGEGFEGTKKEALKVTYSSWTYDDKWWR